MIFINICKFLHYRYGKIYKEFSQHYGWLLLLVARSYSKHRSHVGINIAKSFTHFSNLEKVTNTSGSYTAGLAGNTVCVNLKRPRPEALIYLNEFIG